MTPPSSTAPRGRQAHPILPLSPCKAAGGAPEPLPSRWRSLRLRAARATPGLPGVAGLVGVAVAVLALAARPALAQDDVEQAKAFFTAGAKLYDQGNYVAATQAFEEAYRIAPRPPLLFSIAQAEKRQYFVDKSTDTLRRAIGHYRQYLDVVKQGGRRADAAQALSELELVSARVDPQPAGAGSVAAPPPPPPPPSKPRLSVMATQTRGAQIWVDGKPAIEGIFSDEVAPGKHAIKVSADGYFDEEREVTIQKAPVALDIALREKPARLTFVTADGAQISVDGRLVGITPLPVAVDLPAGSHVITIAKNGHDAFSQEIEMDRGEAKTINAELRRTGQRTVSYVLLGTAAASVVAGGVFVGLALHQQSVAKGIDSDRSQGNITQDDLDRYNNALNARDKTWKPAAAGAFGGGLALGAIGALLYAFDQPAVGAPGAGKQERPHKPEPPPSAPPSMEMSASPFVGPGFLGATMSERF
jgi:tetratricopeptide (TPR) repeat protein